MTHILIGSMGDFYPLFIMALRSSMLATIGDQSFHILPTVKTGLVFVVGMHHVRVKANNRAYIDRVLPPIRLNIQGDFRDPIKAQPSW